MSIYGMLFIAYLAYAFAAITWPKKYNDFWLRTLLIVNGAFSNFLLYKLGFWTVDPWTWKQIYLFSLLSLGIIGGLFWTDKVNKEASAGLVTYAFFVFHIWIYASSGVFH